MRSPDGVFTFGGARFGDGSFLSWPRDALAQVRIQFLFCAVATCIDAVGTVIHLARGAKEMNPVWIGLIEQMGAVPAMGIRMLVGLLLLGLLFSFWRYRVARTGFTIVMAAFIPLTLYHLFLFIYLPLVT